jgi:hypothetical protein
MIRKFIYQWEYLIVILPGDINENIINSWTRFIVNSGRKIPFADKIVEI